MFIFISEFVRHILIFMCRYTSVYICFFSLTTRTRTGLLPGFEYCICLNLVARYVIFAIVFVYVLVFPWLWLGFCSDSGSVSLPVSVSISVYVSVNVPVYG